MQTRQLSIAFALCSILHSAGATSESGAAAGVNPIRKVTTLLQSMAKKVEAQVETEKELHDKFQCNCKTAIPDLEKSIAANTQQGPALQSELTGARSELGKLKEEIAAHKITVNEAKTALDEAAGVRATESKAFEGEAGEKQQFIASIKKAVPALTGAPAAEAGSFLQTNNALKVTLHRATLADSLLTEDDRDSVTAFISTGQISEEQSPGEIAGILQNMQTDYEKDLAAITEAEDQAKAVYKQLVAAKTLQLKSVKTAMRKKNGRAGTLSINVVNLKHDKKDADSMLEADQTMLQNLQTDCTTEGTTFQTRAVSRSQELVAISETIKILSSDDALDVFKATLPASAAAAAFLQTRTTVAKLQNARAAAAAVGSSPQNARPEARFLQLSLLAKKVDFSKVNKMVDDMVALLKREQKDDDSTIESCKAQFHKTDLKTKELASSITEQEANKDERLETLQAVTDELQDLQAEVVALDKVVDDATKERKEQNTDFTGIQASNTAAKEILEFAKKRLAAFYAPGASKDIALTAQKSSVNMAMSTPELFEVLDARGPRVPKMSLLATSAAAVKSQQKSIQKVLGGVDELITKLINDVKVQMTEAKYDEDHAQTVYETLLKDASSKRATYVKSIQVKEASKAENEVSKTREGSALDATYKDSKATKAMVTELHDQCDWLMQNYEYRLKARTEEADNLSKAKDVLQGADYSLVQAHSNLRGKQ